VSFASTLLLSGFGVLSGTNGEPLNFRGQMVNGIVNLDPFAKVIRSPDFNPRDTSEIELKTVALASVAPRPGEEFVDGKGLAHRIETFRRRGDYYLCQCQVSEPLYAILLNAEGQQLANDEGDLQQAAA
jgi:hypothetical protein